ncbi:AsmA family protein [Xanthomonas oryzae pv. oryzae]|nr:AsmA family protein [Xanthomonas oryzae pv. oryzae]
MLGIGKYRSLWFLCTVQIHLATARDLVLGCVGSNAAAIDATGLKPVPSADADVHGML